MAFNMKKFAFRVQLRPASKTKGRRLSIVSQKKIPGAKAFLGQKEKGAAKVKGKVTENKLRKGGK